MTRVAIYARYSSDKQSERSIEDQVRLCSERVEREGGVGHFDDEKLRGDRPRTEHLDTAGEDDGWGNLGGKRTRPGKPVSLHSAFAGCGCRTD